MLCNIGNARQPNGKNRNAVKFSKIQEFDGM